MLDSRLNLKTMKRNLLCARGKKVNKDKKNQRIKKCEKEAAYERLTVVKTKETNKKDRAYKVT